MVDEHLCEVLPLDIKPLGYGERPVEGQLHHVVPPDRPLNIMVRIVVPGQQTTFLFYKKSVKRGGGKPRQNRVHLRVGNIRADRWFGVDSGVLRECGGY